jgi:hypothetical protein
VERRKRKRKKEKRGRESVVRHHRFALRATGVANHERREGLIAYMVGGGGGGGRSVESRERGPTPKNCKYSHSTDQQSGGGGGGG